MKKFSMIYLLVIIPLLFFHTCKETTLEPQAALITYNGCKSFASYNQDQATAPLGKKDCLTYQYDGNNTLQLTHINAGFNCCPGEITAEITFNNNVITITEREREAGCLCNCLFDIEYEIENLKPGEYRIIVNEPYVAEGDEKLDFIIDLSSSPVGEYCVERDNYPWL